MDFGAFIITALVTLAFLATLGHAAIACLAKPPARRNHLIVSGTLAVLLLPCPLLCLAFLYKVYYLDEGLVTAAAAGDVARVKVLLGHGASPNACWEDGTSAMQFAKEAHSDELIETLKAAGAKD